MKLYMYSVYDSKAEAYLPPLYLKNDAVAVRAFEATCLDGVSEFSKHPEDYTLFFVGTFQDNDCSFELEPTPRPLRKALELVAGREVA